MAEENDKIGKRLITTVAELTRKDHLLGEAKHMDTKQLDKVIRQEQKTTTLTKDYAKLFYEISPKFYEWLNQQAAPNKLTNTDLKYCSYILLRMNNKELAHVLNVEYNTVVTQKYHLKKKLHLSKDESLDEFIVNFTPVD